MTQLAFTSKDAAVWRAQYDQIRPVHKSFASNAYLEGALAMGLCSGALPDLCGINDTLARRAGWQLHLVQDRPPSVEFFHLLAACRFPVSVRLWVPEHAYEGWPTGLFHDVVGHIPFLLYKPYREALKSLGQFVAAYQYGETAAACAMRMFWHTLEMGLLHEGNEVKLLGATLLSSVGESLHAVGGHARRVDFHTHRVLNAPHEDGRKGEYFVLDAPDQLVASIPMLERAAFIRSDFQVCPS